MTAAQSGEIDPCGRMIARAFAAAIGLVHACRAPGVVIMKANDFAVLREPDIKLDRVGMLFPRVGRVERERLDKEEAQKILTL